MKKKITSLLKESIDTLQAKEIFLGDIKIDIHVTESKNLEHGDYATNIALQISKEIKKEPLEVAQNIKSIIEKDKLFKQDFGKFFIERFDVSLGSSTTLSFLTALVECCSNSFFPLF